MKVRKRADGTLVAEFRVVVQDADGSRVEHAIGTGPAAPRWYDEAAKVLRRGLREMYRRQPEAYLGKLKVMWAAGLPAHVTLELLDEEISYFHSVRSWRRDCAVIGAVFSKFFLESRIDTDLESQFFVDRTDGRPDPGLYSRRNGRRAEMDDSPG